MVTSSLISRTGRARGPRLAPRRRARSCRDSVVVGRGVRVTVAAGRRGRLGGWTRGGAFDERRGLLRQVDEREAQAHDEIAHLQVARAAAASPLISLAITSGSTWRSSP